MRRISQPRLLPVRGWCFYQCQKTPCQLRAGISLKYLAYQNDSKCTKAILIWSLDSRTGSRIPDRWSFRHSKASGRKNPNGAAWCSHHNMTMWDPMPPKSVMHHSGSMTRPRWSPRLVGHPYVTVGGSLSVSMDRTLSCGATVVGLGGNPTQLERKLAEWRL